MAVRLRPVVLVAAVVIGLLAAFPHLTGPSGSATRVDAVAPTAVGRGLGACAPGAQRCDPSTPSSSAAGPFGVGLVFVAAGVVFVLGIRRSRRRRSAHPLARGVALGIDRPPRLLLVAY